MEKAIGVRLPEDVLKRIEKLSEEVTDRSTTIRKLVMLGYQDLMKRRSAEEYLRGSITFSEAAHRAGLTVGSGKIPGGKRFQIQLLNRGPAKRNKNHAEIAVPMLMPSTLASPPLNSRFVFNRFNCKHLNGSPRMST